MSEISASLVKELREKTGAGMMDCKKALSEAGDLEGAIKFLRERGLAQAAKKTGRVAAEGVVAIESLDGMAGMVELNSETDFVARNEDFQKLASDLAKTALKFAKNGGGVFDGEAMQKEAFVGGGTVEAVIIDKIATIGEKISCRRFAALSGGDLYGTYIHGTGSIGVIVELELGDKNASQKPDMVSAARDVAMHVAASNPMFIREEEVDQTWANNERTIFKTQMLAQGKPESMVDKIVEGKMKKHMQDNCLLDQPFVKNPDINVRQMLDTAGKNVGTSINVKRMVRFKVGEGIEKKEDNFADEVKKMMA